MEQVDGVRVDPARWPERLRGLMSIMHRWVRSDDLEREAALDSATDDELRGLFDEVRPHFEAINAYLDEVDNEDNAIALGTLAEVAMEAAFEYERRTGEGLLS